MISINFLLVGFTFNNPRFCSVDKISGDLFFTDDYRVTRILSTAQSTYTILIGDTSTASSIDGTGTAAKLNSPMGVVVNPKHRNILYIAEFSTGSIRQVNLTNIITSTPLSSAISSCWDMVIDNQGIFIYTSQQSNKLFQITISGWTFITFAGSVNGLVDGPLISNAKFSSIEGLAIDISNNLYVSTLNLGIRFVSTLFSTVNTLAGANGGTGSADGLGYQVTFNLIYDVETDPYGTMIFIPDYGNHNIRQISCTPGYNLSFGNCYPNYFVPSFIPTSMPSNPTIQPTVQPTVQPTTFQPTSTIQYVSNIMVTTVVGSGTNTNVDGIGTSASFAFPWFVVLDITNKFMLVGDNYSSYIRKLVISTLTMTSITSKIFLFNLISVTSFFVGFTVTSLRYGVADRLGNFYVTDANRVRKIPEDLLSCTILAGTTTCKLCDL